MTTFKRTIVRLAPVLGALIVSSGVAAGAASASVNAPNINPGQSGRAVICVQEAVNRGDGAGVSVDGVDGPQTTKAVKTYQSRRGLTADGIVGRATGNYIWADDWALGDLGCYAYIPTPT
jgi:peptidoglycan hydrolase-like protein with peptidoglycan-binding domain